MMMKYKYSNKSNSTQLITKPFLSILNPYYYQSHHFKTRLETFYYKHSPHYISRIPLIIEAYQDQPHLLFGDLDHNYQTHASTRRERRLWKQEPIHQKRVRVQVAQDYIYRQLPTQLLLPKEYTHQTIATSLS